MVKFDGFHENMLTMIADGEITGGSPVKMSQNKTISSCADGDSFVGTCKVVRDGFASIQLTGYVKVDFTGTAPALGMCTLVANGTGGVKTGSGRQVTMLEVNSDSGTCGFVL